MEISITRALKELTLLDKRIEDAIDDSIFVGYAKKSSTKIKNIYTREEFDKLVTSNFDSVQALMNRRLEIKAKIVDSNAKTMVTIGGKEYTVAAAIEAKSLIFHKKNLLETLESQLKNATAIVSRENEKVDEKVYQLIKEAKNEDNTSVDLGEDSYIIKYRNKHEFDLVNPIKIHEKIVKLKEEIENFENEVDFVLSESNAITKITISD